LIQKGEFPAKARAWVALPGMSQVPWFIDGSFFCDINTPHFGSQIGFMSRIISFRLLGDIDEF
jgi:hypothetical protein